MIGRARDLGLVWVFFLALKIIQFVLTWFILYLFNLDHESTAVQSYLQTKLLILVLWLLPPHLWLLPPWSLEPLKSFMGAGIHFFQTPAYVDILTSFHESQIFLMAWRMVNPFQFFNVLCPDPSEELPSMALALQIVVLKSQDLQINYSLIHGLQNRCYVSMHENNDLIVYLHQSS